MIYCRSIHLHMGQFSFYLGTGCVNFRLKMDWLSHNFQAKFKHHKRKIYANKHNIHITCGNWRTKKHLTMEMIVYKRPKVSTSSSMWLILLKFIYWFSFGLRFLSHVQGNNLLNLWEVFAVLWCRSVPFSSWYESLN